LGFVNHSFFIVVFFVSRFHLYSAFGFRVNLRFVSLALLFNSISFFSKVSGKLFQVSKTGSVVEFIETSRFLVCFFGQLKF